jgi:hypothetical protein
MYIFILLEKLNSDDEIIITSLVFGKKKEKEYKLNDIKYKTVIDCCNLERVKHIIKNNIKIFRENEKCISCKSILKKENWKNKMMFSNIFTEIQIFQRLKQIVKYDILLNELMEQKNLEYPIILNILQYFITI